MIPKVVIGISCEVHGRTGFGKNNFVQETFASVVMSLLQSRKSGHTQLAMTHTQVAMTQECKWWTDVVGHPQELKFSSHEGSGHYDKLPPWQDVPPPVRTSGPWSKVKGRMHINCLEWLASQDIPEEQNQVGQYLAYKTNVGGTVFNE